MDDLVELALEIGGEVLELLADLLFGSGRPRKKHREKRKGRRADAPAAEPWERREERPPWEE